MFVKSLSAQHHAYSEGYICAPHDSDPILGYWPF